MKKYLIALLSLLSLSASAGSRGSFAIIVDKESYVHCKEQLELYSSAIQVEGLDAFIASEKWACPEQVRDSLKHWYKSRNLKGTVFIGEIPVAMIRKAQFMASAFKMDEKRDRRESSIPSDRFYDDFDLKFSFVGRDTSQTNLFYYELAPDSNQEICCDIFSGRIMPSSKYRNKYTELKKYLEKVTRLKGKPQLMDRVASYTGAGSFSNSMIAWKDEAVTLKEQIPDAFRNIDGAKFFVYHQYPFMKEILLEECGRDDLDLMLYHHHGTPDRQWIGDYPASFNEEEAFEYGRRQARSAARRNVRYGMSHEEAIRSVIEKYSVDSSWVSDAFDPETVKADSIEDLKTGILLDDIYKTKPNARMYIFDACYNGDFREEDNIANRYIMSDGNAVAAIGNTVNVLQDKASSMLLGMMSAGYNIGEWHQATAILESVVIGDPTFCFASSYKFKKPDLSNTNIGYWKRFLNKKYPCDIQGLALNRLYELNAPGLPEILAKACNSDYYMLRLTALTLLKHYDSPLYRKALVKALDDPYEYTRRKAGYFLSMMGDTSAVTPLADALIKDYNAARVNFNITNGAGFFPDSLFLETFKDMSEKAGFFYKVPESAAEGSNALENAINGINSSLSIREFTYKAIRHTGKDAKGRSSTLAFLRNQPYPQYADDLLSIVKDSEEPMEIRIQVADILGWYIVAYNKREICNELVNYLPGVSDKRLADEISKTIRRLKVYLK